MSVGIDMIGAAAASPEGYSTARIACVGGLSGKNGSGPPENRRIVGRNVRAGS